MRGVTWRGTKEVRFDDVSHPQLQGAHDTIICVDSTGICGSHFHRSGGVDAHLEPGHVSVSGDGPSSGWWCVGVAQWLSPILLAEVLDGVLHQLLGGDLLEIWVFGLVGPLVVALVRSVPAPAHLAGAQLVWSFTLVAYVVGVTGHARLCTPLVADRCVRNRADLVAARQAAGRRGYVASP